MDELELQKVLREKYIVNGKSADTVADRDAWEAVRNTCEKMRKHFTEHERISISVSGGSDSDCIVHLVCTYFPEFLYKCKFVFVNTGLEYDATKRHLVDLEKRYGIEIDRIRGLSVVAVVREHGVPILSKMKAHMLGQYVGGKKWATDYIFGDKIHSFNSFKFTKGQQELAMYLKQNNINVSSDCCTYSKKKPLTDYEKKHDIDLVVTGERQAEGGQRAVAHKSCFQEYKNDISRYMPLWWWSNEVKSAFKEAEGIRYSDCYEVYGMKRTGCVGCPFNLNIADDLQAMYEYEPQLYKACMNVFGQAYELTDRFNCRRKKCLPDFLQMTLTGEIERSESD